MALKGGTLVRLSPCVMASLRDNAKDTTHHAWVPKLPQQIQKVLQHSCRSVADKLPYDSASPKWDLRRPGFAIFSCDVVCSEYLLSLQFPLCLRAVFDMIATLRCALNPAAKQRCRYIHLDGSCRKEFYKFLFS